MIGSEIRKHLTRAKELATQSAKLGIIDRLAADSNTSSLSVRHCNLIPLVTALAIGQASPSFPEELRQQVWSAYFGLLKILDRLEPGASTALALDQLDNVDALALHDEQTGCIADAEWDIIAWTTAEGPF